MARIQVEPAVPLSEHCGTWARKREDQTSDSSGIGCIGSGGSSSSGGGADTRWLNGSLAVVSGCLGVFDDVRAEEAENSNVKLELGVSSIPS